MRLFPFDQYDQDDLANHHPTCPDGCGELADECTCDSKPFCQDCPDHEACMTGWPCKKVREVDRQAKQRDSGPAPHNQGDRP